MATSTTQRSLKYMRDNGFYAEVVERYNSFTKRKNDFAGFIDILCLGQGAVIGVQTTSWGHTSDRLKKILEHENLNIVREAGIKIEVHGWQKKGARWQVKIIHVE
jgi:hypothetical protein